VLDRTAPRFLALPMLALGVLAAAAGLLSAGRRVERSRYRPDHWRWPELAVAASGITVGALGWWVGAHQVLLAYPIPTGMPRISGVSLLGIGIALLGAFCAPPVRSAYVAPAVAAQELAA